MNLIIWGTRLNQAYPAVASPADSSRVPPPRASSETSHNLRRPITTDFQILEVLFGP